MKYNTKLHIAVTLGIVIGIFVLISYLVQKNIVFFDNLITSHYALGIFIFIFAEVLAIVVAPITSLPLIPIASNTYGPLLTAFFYILGGIVGSFIAFWIGKTYGKNLVKKLVSIERAEEVSAAIPKKNLFVSLVLLRIVVPADILSYALGIFTEVGYGMFLLTLVVGTIPGAFYFSYLGALPLGYQILGWVGGLVFLVTVLYFMFRKKEFSEKKRENK